MAALREPMQHAVSKGEFATIIGVLPGRVSQYLIQGKITAAALVGSGRNAKIDVERAKADLRLTLDVSQLLGNGSDTNLDAGGSSVPAGSAMPSPGAGQPSAYEPRGADYEIKQEKLAQIKRVNRNAAIEDAKNAGLLTETAAAKNEMTRAVAALVEMFEGSLIDMATDIAAAFELLQRDVKHILRKRFRTFRETASKQMAMKAIALNPLVGTEIDAEEIEQTAIS